MAEMVDCPTCKGSGKYKGSTCQTCGGSGRVKGATKEQKRHLGRKQPKKPPRK